MIKPLYELADIIKQHKHTFFSQHHPHLNTVRVLHALELCRTSALGGHVDACNTCGHKRISYNSCRNRHCPKCQTTNREQWIMQRQKDLLPVGYFHVVFTIPEQINTFCMHHPEAVYTILFDAAKQTIESFAQDEKHLGAQTGIISVLHTWGQNLSLHPHVHMIVPAGGISRAGFWKHAKSNGKFLFPVKALSVVFKNKFMEQLRALLVKLKTPLEPTLRSQLYQKQWVVYAKQPFAGPEQVIEYLGRYSHKIAISNHRIKNVTKDEVHFMYKDYAQGGKQKTMALKATEFLRRFCLHILPHGFRKIRHYGILASRNKPKLRSKQLQMGVLPKATKKLDWKQLTKEKLGFDVDQCPCCKTGKMIRLLSFEANAPPTELMQTARQQPLISAN